MKSMKPVSLVEYVKNNKKVVESSSNNIDKGTKNEYENWYKKF